MECPNCRTESTGAFCPECGTRLRPGRCPSCDAETVSGARYCTQCGTRLAGSSVSASSLKPALYAAAAVFVLVAGYLLLARRDASTDGAARAPLEQAGPAASGPGTPPPLTGTPREQADRLFNRIMGAAEQGDTAQARFFTPMAIQAYRNVGDLDADGLFHLSLVQTIGGEPAEGLVTAEQILEGSPDHLLGLIAAAQAAEAAGNEDAAREHYRRFLRVYDAERARDLPEYRDHGPVLPGYRRQAETKLAE